MSEPESLRRNADKWKKELLQALHKRKKAAQQMTGLLTRYKQEDVLSALNTMYSGLCCYCEAEIAPVAYPNIEHRRPKKLFPEDTFKWDNLHLPCTVCNTRKGNKYNGKAEILDAASDTIKIKEHLSYERRGRWLYRWPLTDRGETTCLHADLNRDDLLEKRGELYVGALEEVEKLRAHPEMPSYRVAIEALRKMCQEEYGSVIEHAMRGLDANSSSGNTRRKD